MYHPVHQPPPHGTSRIRQPCRLPLSPQWNWDREGILLTDTSGACFNTFWQFSNCKTVTNSAVLGYFPVHHVVMESFNSNRHFTLVAALELVTYKNINPLATCYLLNHLLATKSGQQMPCFGLVLRLHRSSSLCNGRSSVRPPTSRLCLSSFGCIKFLHPPNIGLILLAHVCSKIS
jgi:hypothetical protein